VPFKAFNGTQKDASCILKSWYKKILISTDCVSGGKTLLQGMHPPPSHAADSKKSSEEREGGLAFVVEEDERAIIASKRGAKAGHIWGPAL